MNKLSFKDALPLIKDSIQQGKEVEFNPEGNSMKPMLKKGDAVILKKPDLPLKKYELPLYMRGNEVILHRVVKVKENSYSMRGDNTWSLEENITDSDIIGVVRKFCRKGKWYSVKAKGYLFYVYVWNLLFPVRHFIHTLKYLFKKYIKIKKL